jgi:serine/threonine protein kinase/Flp pilus assembly protein TadD
MNGPQQLLSSPATPLDASAVGRSPARTLVSVVIRRWNDGEEPDTNAVLSRHPELRDEKSFVLDLAYEEYCQRLEAGEKVDPDAFCDRFPAFQASLRRLIGVHQIADDPLLDPDPSADTVPEVPVDFFLGFALQRELGRGAFARVFLATEPALGHRRVAVKISHQGRAEAHTLGRINHPNIVPVHSVQEDPATGLTGVCMPYLGSATLCDVLDRVYSCRPRLPTRGRDILDAIRNTVPPGDVPADEAPPDPVLDRCSYVDGVLHLGAQLADALAFIHARGICHRDLKPSNVLLGPTGRPMLLDFNLSADAHLADNPMGGTLPYMAPEQLRATPMASSNDPALTEQLDPSVDRGSQTVRLVGSTDPGFIDARSDLFALGVILYELLAGRHPFGPLPLKLSLPQLRAQLLQRQRIGFRPLREANPAVSWRVAELVERCLSYDPKDRPASAAHLAQSLRHSLGWWPRLRRRIAAHPRRIVAVGVLLAAAGIAGAVDYQNQPPTAVIARQRGVDALQKRDFKQAVAHLTKAMEFAGKEPTLLFARGRAYQHLGEIDLACRDYMAADKLTPEEFPANGRYAACIGYCLSRIDRHDWAIGHYQKAIALGFAPAEVLNDLAYSQLVSGADLESVRATLQKALQQNGGLQAVHHNLARLDLKKAVRRPHYIPEEAMPHLRLAFGLGLPDQELFADAARLYVLVGYREELRQNWQAVLRHEVGQLAALRPDPLQLPTRLSLFAVAGPLKNPPRPWADTAILYLREAVTRGHNPQWFADDPCLRVLAAEPAFQALITSPRPTMTLSPSARLVDPIADDSI